MGQSRGLKNKIKLWETIHWERNIKTNEGCKTIKQDGK